LVLLLAAGFAWWQRTKAPAPTLSDKSIAVLHFKNLSEEKGNSFFADGMHDSILTRLTQVGQLRVVSSTSVEQYRESKQPLRQIAQELGVAYVLEGSVQRAGNKVRVTGQLIHAATDGHVWAKSYDKDLTDIFAIQSELAQEIAASLHAVLSPQEKKLLERKPTENLAAYDLYVQAREILRDTKTSARRVNAEVLLLEAVRLDPKFVLAWGDLCYLHASFYINYIDRTEARVAKCREAMERIIVLAPDWPGRLRAVGDYYYFCLGDVERGKEAWQTLVRLQPNNCEALGGLSAIARRQGRLLEALAYSRAIQKLDPRYFSLVRQIPGLLEAGRRYNEAEEERRRSLSPQSGGLSESFALALLSFRARGSTREVDELLGKLSSSEAESDEGIRLRKRWAILTGNQAEWSRLDQLKPNLAAAAPVLSPNAGQLVKAVVQAANGDVTGARARVANLPARLRQQLAGDPADDRVWATLGMVEALLGHDAEAQRCADKAVDLVPEQINTQLGPRYSASRAFVYAWTGDKDKAIAEYARLLRVPYSGLNIYEMKHDPWYFPLRGDPRWEALLADLKNNAPLF